MIKHAVVGDVNSILMDLHNQISLRDGVLNKDTLDIVLKGLLESIIKLDKVRCELYDEDMSRLDDILMSSPDYILRNVATKT